MNNRVLYSRTMRYQRVAVKNTFSLFSLLQDHGERLFKKSLEQNSWLPEKGKKACTCLADTCFNSARLFEKIIDRNFDDLEKFYRSGEKQQKKETQSKKTETSKSSQANTKPSEDSIKTVPQVKTGTKATPSEKGGMVKKKTAKVEKQPKTAQSSKEEQPPTVEQPPISMSTGADDPAPPEKEIKEKKSQIENVPQPSPLSDKKL